MRTHTFMAWPENPVMSFQITRILGLIDFGGADFTEVYEVIQKVDPNNTESWYSEWYSMGQLVEKMGVEAEEKGNYIVARNAFQRACNYYRLAQFFEANVEKRISTLKKMHSVFEQANKYFENPVEKIYVPYEGDKLQGYFVPAFNKEKKKNPTMIYVNGADSLSPEVYFTAGKTMSEAGYSFLVFDAPGVGLTLYEKGLPTRYDSEKFVSAAVNYVLTREDVDKEKIILIGESFAGYLVPRALSFEKRIKAAIVWSPLYEFSPKILYDSPARDHVMKLFNAKTKEEYVNNVSKFTLKGVLNNVTCPILLIQGAEDYIIPSALTSALKIYDEVCSEIKSLRIIERDEGLGGVQHCQKDNLHVAHFDTINWLREIGIV